VYLIQVIIILGIFLTKIDQGEDSVSQWNNVGKMLVIALVIYFIIAVVATEIFAGLIESALSDFLVS